MAAATAHPPSALMTSRTTRIAQANAPGAPLAVRTPAQEEYTAVVMASTSPVAPRRLLATAVRTATRSMANTIRAGGLTRKGPGSRSGSVPVVPPQEQPDNISNAALCRSGPGLIEQADRAGLQRGNGWAVLRPVRVEVEDVAKFLLGEAVAHATPRSCALLTVPSTIERFGAGISRSETGHTGRAGPATCGGRTPSSGVRRCPPTRHLPQLGLATSPPATERRSR
jgi:hypothetical protein